MRIVMQEAAGAAVKRYIDTHAHLHSVMGKLQGVASVQQLGDVMQAAQLEHCALAAVVNVFCEPADFVERSADHYEVFRLPNVFGSWGVHPHEAKHWNAHVESELLRALKHERCVALGECGLDFHYNFSGRDEQLLCFRRQCELAKQMNLPLVVHSREAEQDTIDILKELMPVDHHIHLHCFTSSAQMARTLLDHFPNLYIGFTGVVSFKNSADVQAVVRDVVPIDRILLETDAPYMAPAPHRGKTCHSGHAWLTAKVICKLKGIPEVEGFQKMYDNAVRMYNLKI